jgi:hypothetical protein
VRPRIRIATAGLAVAGLAAIPASALAALEVAVQPSEARYGQSHHVVGRLTDDAGEGLSGRRVALEKRDFPYTGVFRPISHATTGKDGTFTFDEVTLARNADLRVVSFDGTTSGIARAWTYPAFTLRYTPIAANRIEVTQTYRTPRSVRLRAPTLFFLSKASAKRSTLRVRARTTRKAPGRFTATATVVLPKSWHGRFRYASCFGYTKGSGMGDPARGCPKRFTF